MNVPGFLAQERLRRLLCSTYRRALLEARGAEPTDAEQEEFARRELPALAAEFGANLLVRLATAPATAPPLDPPGDLEQAWLTPAQRREAESALWFAKLHNIPSITDALRWHSVCNRAALAAPPLRRCADLFYLAKRAEGLSPYTLHQYRLRLERFVALHPDRRPGTLVPRELTAYFRRWPNTASRLAHWHALAAFFNWLMRSRYILENPLALGLRRPRPPGAARLIYTPEEAAHLLRLTKHTNEAGHWALSLFGGLRHCELSWLQSQRDPWQLFTTRIDLTGLPTRLNRRVVDILPVLSAWLVWMKDHGVPFQPPNHFAKLRLTRAAVLAPRFNGPPPDTRVHAMARRTYVSYRLALTTSSYVRVADDTGVTERLLRSRFSLLVTRAEAEHYFSLRPSAV